MLLVFKEKKILSFMTIWVKLKDRERQIPHGITYMWNLKKKKRLNSETKSKEVVVKAIEEVGKRVRTFSCKMNKV